MNRTIHEARQRHKPVLPSPDAVAEEVIALYAPYAEKTTVFGNFKPTGRDGVNVNQEEAVAAVLSLLREAGMKEKGLAIGLLGAMGGGKTTTICLLAERLGPETAHIHKHRLDLTRTGSRLVNHTGDVMTHAALYESLGDITPRPGVTVIDEFQFANDDYASLASFLNRQKEERQHTVLGLLDLDFKRDPWPLAWAAIDLVDHVMVVQPRCTGCGEQPAEFTQRTVNGVPARVDDQVVVVGAEERYQARCGACHDVGGKPKSVYR